MKHIAVERIPDAHPKMRVRDWLAPLVCRLNRSENYSDGSQAIRFSLRRPKGIESEDNLTFVWAGMQLDFSQMRRTYQEPVLTEFATYALACASVEQFAQMEITGVTRRGQRVDFWIGDYELVLEVSGQQQGNLQRLHEIKRRQFQENPMEKNGYVCVASYSEGVALFWYHEYES